MKRKIFYFKGSGNTGKTTKINTVAEWIINTYRIANTIGLDTTNLEKDTYGILTIGKLKIGINSAGDNKPEVSKIDNFAQEVDIIICSCRTKNGSFQHIRSNYNYAHGWLGVKLKVDNLASTDIAGQATRDTRLIEDLKTWLIGLEK